MPVKIRLMRIGARRRPFYRVVAVDERKKRTGAYLELLGTYNPLTNPKEIILKQDRIDWWVSRGAVASDGYLRIIKQAPQKPPRKPKKAQKEKVETTAKEEPKEVLSEEVKETPKRDVEEVSQEVGEKTEEKVELPEETTLVEEPVAEDIQEKKKED